MQSTRNIKRQIRTIKNTSQITKAMEMVSASKMKKSQEAALRGRPYAEAALRLLENVSEVVEPTRHILLERRKTKNLYLLVVTSDKGLCGGLNSGVLREAQIVIDKNKEKNIKIIAVGKKAENYFKKTGNVLAVFGKIGDTVELRETLPISKLIIKEFTDKKCDKVKAIYTNFISTLKQSVKSKNILPVTKGSMEETVEEIEDTNVKIERSKENNIEYKFEPSPDDVLYKLLPNLIEIQIYHIILESNASEHSARMIAMKNATDNAIEMLSDLNLYYNYTRQQKITQEISEISAGASALEG